YISLREYDSTDAPRITTIPYGEAVTYLGEAQSGFVKVSYRGATGYSLMKYLTTVQPQRG
ncbi:MAG: SH3 domain-containing protein, partial [Clostridia bacterium]|nr:SH3 domain-containing protein [Clostridia bacterium]